MWIVKVFKYIEPVWLGNDNKLSIRRCLTLIFSFNLTYNISSTLGSKEHIQSYADVALLLGVEAGLIAALMSLTTYSAALTTKKENINQETD